MGLGLDWDILFIFFYNVLKFMTKYRLSFKLFY